MLSKPMRTSLTANPDVSSEGHGTEHVYSNNCRITPFLVNTEQNIQVPVDRNNKRNVPNMVYFKKHENEI